MCLPTRRHRIVLGSFDRFSIAQTKRTDSIPPQLVRAHHITQYGHKKALGEGGIGQCSISTPLGVPK